MTREQYFALVAACDDLLLAPDAPDDIVAVPWLHVIREHPVFLDRYRPVFDSVSSWQDLRERARQRVAAARVRWQPSSGASRLEPPPGPVDVMFVSHLLNAARITAPDDFYFGDVPADLRAAGLGVLTMLIDQTPGGAGARGFTGTGTSVFSRRLAASSERRIARRLAAVARYLRKSAAGRPAFQARVRTCAAWSAQGPEASAGLRIAEQVEMLTQRFRPRAVVTTHEGHGWERLIFQAARRGHPGVQAIGYHATALFEMQHALTRPLRPEHNPDVILTAGRVTRDALASRPGLRGQPIDVLGSNRRIEAVPRNSGAVPPACVVVPEGFASECRILFQFAIAAARLDPAVRWLLRLHPLLSFSEVLGEIGLDAAALPPNVVLSTRTLEEDFRDSSWALYRGSSAAIQALAAGLRPIYVRAGEPFTIDPMFSLTTWRKEVSTPEGALEVIGRDRVFSPMALEDAWRHAAAYASEYFQPLSSEVLLRTLGATA